MSRAETALALIFQKSDAMAERYPDEPDYQRLDTYDVQLTYERLRGGDDDTLATLRDGDWITADGRHWSDVSFAPSIWPQPKP